MNIVYNDVFSWKNMSHTTLKLLKFEMLLFDNLAYETEEVMEQILWVWSYLNIDSINSCEIGCVTRLNHRIKILL